MITSDNMSGNVKFNLLSGANNDLEIQRESTRSGAAVSSDEF